MEPTPASLDWSEDNSPFARDYDDHYFSRVDGQAECAHVFLAGNGLPARWEGAARFHIGELGFGTGLNFLETWRQWRTVRQAEQTLLFTSLEAHWMTRQEAETALSAFPALADLGGRLLESWGDFDAPIELDAQTVLCVHAGEAIDMIDRFAPVDAWYLDGFSPAKNPAMWSAELMQAVHAHTVPGGTFSSFTAAGWVRRNLAEAGFTVEKRPGFGTKRDMIAGMKA